MIIVITSCYNQLGNQMILFAHFIAFSIEHNSTVFNLGSFNKYAYLFEETKQKNPARYPVSYFYSFALPPQSIPLLESSVRFLSKLIGKFYPKINAIKVIKDCEMKKGDTHFCLADQTLQESLESTKILISQGYLFRAYSLLEKHSDTVRAYFKPAKEYQDNVESLIEKLRKEAQILVGIHIRQGDYKTFMDGTFYYSSSQYVKMMMQVKDLFPGEDVKFLVCSNVKQSESTFEGLNISFPTGHLLEDMYALAKCDYIMGPPSSYTAWAAFYGKVPLYVVSAPEFEITLEKFHMYAVPPV